MPINSRSKGKRGELEAAEAWRAEFGLSKEEVYRSAQREGKETSDLKGGDDELHIEVKRPKRTAFWQWVQQVRRDKKPEQVGLVLFRPDGDREWWVGFPLDQTRSFVRVVERILQKGQHATDSDKDER